MATLEEMRKDKIAAMTSFAGLSKEICGRYLDEADDDYETGKCPRVVPHKWSSGPCYAHSVALSVALSVVLVQNAAACRSMPDPPSRTLPPGPSLQDPPSTTAE